jgi:hypothetical protein
MSKFPLGQVVATPGALAALDMLTIAALLNRHENGDWGDVDAADAAENERSLLAGDRILSAYHTSAGVKLWIITEADRSSTCVLLPEEY